jgi:hypothetical protein
MRDSARRTSLAVAVLLSSFGPAQAAYINIDDSNLDTITITAGDFENGFFVNGNPLASGASLTLPDDSNSVFGTWIDRGQTPANARVDLLYAMPGSPAAVTSGVELSASTDGFLATVAGTFGGFTGTPYYATVRPTVDQTSGDVSSGGFPFLSVSFTPEIGSVPEPASFGLFASAFAALAWARRRRS